MTTQQQQTEPRRASMETNTALLEEVANGLANFIDYLHVASNDDGAYAPELDRARHLVAEVRRLLKGTAK